MRADLPSSLPLICLACRRVGEGEIQLHTLALERALRTDGDEVLEGILRCSHCPRRYPIIDGIPLLVADVGAWLARESLGLIDPDLAPEIGALLVAPGPDDVPLARLLEALSIYLDAHWGDRATPPPQPHRNELFEQLAARATRRVPAAIELGCSVGRGVLELARGADLTIGLDTSLASLSRARRLLRGDEVRYLRRVIGRHYTVARIEGARDEGLGRIELLCADAQDPPLTPGRFARVAALNVLDVVYDPNAVLGVVAGLCAPGGEVMCASPYAWQSGFVGETLRIGGEEPERDVVRMLTARGLRVDEETDLEWHLRRDARSEVEYSVHYLRLTKLPT